MYPVKSTITLATYFMKRIAYHVGDMRTEMEAQIAKGVVYQDECHDDYNVWVEQHHLPCIMQITQLLFRLPDMPLPDLNEWVSNAVGTYWTLEVREGALDVFLFMDVPEPLL